MSFLINVMSTWPSWTTNVHWTKSPELKVLGYRQQIGVEAEIRAAMILLNGGAG